MASKRSYKPSAADRTVDGGCQPVDTGRLGGRGKHRYPLVGERAAPMLAHRLAWALHNGADPVGKVVMHTCDNPRCVNPEHLVLGTQAENIGDAVSKRRHPHGELHGNAKLSDDDIRAIRSLVTDGCNWTAIGREFGVSRTTIKRIHTGESWRHVK